MAQLLTPFGELPSQNVKQQASVLLVGTASIGKRALAKAMLERPQDTALSLHVSATLPLPEAAERERIDAVVLVMDITRMDSWLNVHEAIKHLDHQYLFGRACLVVTRADRIAESRLSHADVIRFAETYDLECYFGNLTDAADRNIIADRVIRFAKISSGHCHFVTPALLRSIDLNFD